MTGDLETGKKGAGHNLLREFRLFAGIAVAVALVFGGIQIWQIAFVPHQSRVSVQAERDPIRSTSTAEWVLGFLVAEFTLTGETTPALALPPQTREGQLQVRGREARDAVQEGRVDAVLRVPGSEGEAFALTPRMTQHAGTALEFTLSERQAEEFLGRQGAATLAIQDRTGTPVTGLTSQGEIVLTESGTERGVYRVSVYVDRVLLSLENGTEYLALRVADGREPPLPALDLPIEWLLHTRQASRVLTLPVDLEARRQGDAPPPEPIPVTPEPEPEVEETPPMTPPEPAAPDPAEVRRQQLAGLRGQIGRALDRGDWGQAERLVADAVALGAAGSELTGWRQRIEDGRAIDARNQRIDGLAEEIGSALAQREWEAAEAGVQEIRDLEPTEARLAAWQQAIDEGRAAEARAAEPPPAPPEPIAEPPVDDDALIRQTLADYARSQNDHDIELFLRVWPEVSQDRRRRVERGWNDVRETDYVMEIESIQIDGDTAVALIRQTVTVQQKVGGRSTGEARLRIDLGRRDDGWVIRNLRAL